MSEFGEHADPIVELQAAVEAAEALAKEEQAFGEAYEAFHLGDAARFQSILDHIGRGHDCERICYVFCEKRCVGHCHRLCPERPTRPVDVAEIRAFVQAFAPVARSKQSLTKLLAVAEKEDAKAWQAELRKHELHPFCHQVCHFLCKVRCKRVCRDLCNRPEITRISSIPTPQFDAQGFGSGPSIPPFHVPVPNPPGGVGHHPIGASSWLMGRFNFPSATQYMVEVATAPGGPYNPIIVPVEGYPEIPPPPPPPYLSRVPDGAGWYDIADLFFSDGGNTTSGEKTLMYWPTPADDLYYLRLRVRDGVSQKVSGPRAVRVDNSSPPTPVIKLELKTPSGELKPLKCGKVKKGDGLIRITVQASDPNFSSLGVAAQGNSSLSVPVVAVPEGSMGPAVPLSKTYNGNVLDTGYPVPTSFLWDPWNDPRIVPCCYVVRIDINDRAVLNNVWSGGHSNAGWEAIEIGF